MILHVMNCTEINKIKNQIKPDSKSVNISRLACAYVTVNNQQPALKSFQTIHLDDLEESEQLLYTKMLKKILSGKPGRNLQELSFKRDEAGQSLFQKQLYKLNETRLEDEEYVKLFASQFAKSAGYANGYYLTLAACEYYEIARDHSGMENPDADGSRFPFILAAVNEINLTDIGLYYNPAENAIRKKVDVDMRVLPGAMDGFMYPMILDGSADVSHVLYYTKTPKKPNDLLIENVLGAKSGLSYDEEKAAFADFLKDVAQEDLDLDLISHVFGSLRDLVNDPEEDAAQTLSRNEMKSLLMESGLSSDRLERFDAAYQSRIGEEDLMAVNLLDTDKLSVRMPDITVSVKPDSAYKVKTQMIDGRQYLLIAMDEGLQVNGLDVKK